MAKISSTIIVCALALMFAACKSDVVRLGFNYEADKEIKVAKVPTSWLHLSYDDYKVGVQSNNGALEGPMLLVFYGQKDFDRRIDLATLRETTGLKVLPIGEQKRSFHALSHSLLSAIYESYTYLEKKDKNGKELTKKAAFAAFLKAYLKENKLSQKSMDAEFETLQNPKVDKADGKADKADGKDDAQAKAKGMDRPPMHTTYVLLGKGGDILAIYQGIIPVEMLEANIAPLLQRSQGVASQKDEVAKGMDEEEASAPLDDKAQSAPAKGVEKKADSTKDPKGTEKKGVELEFDSTKKDDKAKSAPTKAVEKKSDSTKSAKQAPAKQADAKG